jgi:oligopeptide/dipeptide ABC transporter ATP-binding protein
MTPAATEPLVRMSGVTVVFRNTRMMGPKAENAAVVDAGLDMHSGEILGLVGESGSGKTTLGRALLGLVPIESGSIELDGVDLVALGRDLPLSVRRRVQPVFQDPLQALNPRHRVERLVGEPLRLHTDLGGGQLRARVVELLEQVGLSESHLRRRTNELSGGQRQRVAIARALAVGPDVLVLDEAVSALDVTTGAQILKLLERVRPDHGATLFISHDIARVRSVCHTVAVMYRGRIVEVGTADQICGDPLHPYTQLLVASVPDPHPHRPEGRRPPAPRDRSAVAVAPGGCPFAPRCPLADERCDVFPPAVLIEGRTVRCHQVADPTVTPGSTPAQIPESTPDPRSPT